MPTSGVGRHRIGQTGTPTRGGWLYDHAGVENPTLTTTPTLPAGSLTVNFTVTGIVLTTTPTLPAGAITRTVVGVVLTTTPSLPAGLLNTNVTGVVLTTTPTLPAGGAQKNQITGVALTTTPTLPAGALATSLTGVVLTTTPSLPAGSLRTSVTGVVLTVTPTLPAGSLTTSLTGVVLTTTPSLPAGVLNTGVLGVTLTTTPSLPAGTLTAGAAVNVVGIALETTPTLPAGSLQINSFHTGVVLTTTPTLPAGSLSTSVTGVVLTTTPSIPGGAADYAAAVLADSPRAYYRLAESSGTNADDSSTNNSDATYNGSGITYSVAGAISGNTAISMNGATWIDLPNGVLDIPTSSSAKSTECWFKTTANDACLIGGRGATDTPVWDLAIGKNGASQDNGKLTLLIRDDANEGIGVLWSTATYNDGQWHHVVATFDASDNMRLYADGALVAGPTNYPTASGFTFSTFARIGEDLYHGTSGAGNLITPLNGSIDEVSIYDTELSAARVLAHYQAGTGSGGAFLRTDVTGVTLTTTPSLPAGVLNTAVTGVTLTTTPTLPPGSFSLASSVTGVALTTTPTLPAGSLTTSVTGKAAWTFVDLSAETGTVTRTDTTIRVDDGSSYGDFWVTSDTGSMAYRPLTTWSVKVKVLALAGTRTNQRFYQLRKSTAANSAMFTILTNGANTGLSIVWRDTDGAVAQYTGEGGPVLPSTPFWVKITYDGATATGYVSTDDITYTIIDTGKAVAGLTLEALVDGGGGGSGSGATFERQEGAIYTTPTLPAGSLTRTVTGVVLTTTPSMPAGTFTVSQIVTGQTLTVLWVLPAGSVTGGLQPRTDTQNRFERGSSNVVVIRPSMTKGQRFTRRP